MKRHAWLVVFSVLFFAGWIAGSNAQTPSGGPRRTAGDASAALTSYITENNRLFTAPVPRWLPTPKRIRVYFAGTLVADSTHAHLLREGGPPVYYFPESDVRTDLFIPSRVVRNSPIRGDASFWSLKVGERVAEDSVWTYREPVEGAAFLKGYLAFQWNKMDAWFEEKDQVFVHARDPFLRIDTVHTDRHVRVVIDGQTVAESDGAVLLFEPGQPIRYYLPIADTRVELLRPSDTTSRCPYKGLANYYSMKLGGRTIEDIAWSYRAPTLESGMIAGMVSFYNERVDAIFVDGEELPKPQTNRGQ